MNRGGLGIEGRNNEMTKMRMAMFAAVMAATGVWADTWTDPGTGYTWKYYINDSGAQIVQGISPEPVDDLEIPATLGGRVVTSMGVSAFDKCVSLRSVSMGNGVKTISTLAFYGCTHLESVRLSENLEVIEDKAFLNCSVLSDVVLPSKLAELGYNAFAG